MQDINIGVIQGRLTEDPEVKHTKSGDSIMIGSIASNRNEKVGDEYQDVPNFFKFSWLHPLAKHLAGKARKGDQLTINYELRHERWENSEGKQSRILLRAKFISWNPSKSNSGYDGDRPAPAKQSSGGFEDDIPF